MPLLNLLCGYASEIFVKGFANPLSEWETSSLHAQLSETEVATKKWPSINAFTVATCRKLQSPTRAAMYGRILNRRTI